MTIDAVKASIKEIVNLANDDPEAARSLINTLYVSLLTGLANSKRLRLSEINTLCTEALKAELIQLKW